MLYTSPFEILDLPIAELQQMDRKMLQLKKKQLLAELELYNNTSIVIKGKEFTKNDIIHLFEELDKGNEMAFHAAIAADPALKQFLQTGGIKASSKFAANDLYQQPAFVEFVSPFYKAAFNNFIIKAVAAKDHSAIAGVFKNPVLLNGQDYDDCFGKLHGYLDEKLNQLIILRSRYDANKKTSLATLIDFYTYDWVLVLNKLPDAFAAYREEYTRQLYNFAVELWNFKNRDEARSLLFGIQGIDGGSRMKKLVDELITLTEQSTQAASTSSNNSGGYRGVWLGISIVVMIIRLAATCGNNHRTSSADYNFSQNLRTISERIYAGYSPLNAVNKRDSAFLYLTNSLYHSTNITYKVKQPVVFKNGDDPYKKYFASKTFTPLPVNKVNERAEEIVEELQNRSRPLPKKDTASYIFKDDDEPATTGTGNELYYLDIKNDIPYETILFFIGNKTVFSVYIQPKSNHTIQLHSDVYHVFAYSGNKFSYNLPLSTSNAKNLFGSQAAMPSGRFDEVNSKMLLCLRPEKNLLLHVSKRNSQSTQRAEININFNDEDYFSFTSGQGIFSVKSSQYRADKSNY